MEDMMNFRAMLTQGFRNIRKEGYFARQNFWCCQTCGCAAVPEDKQEKYVFYHRQDAETMKSRILTEHMFGRCGDVNVGVYLAWNGDPDVIRKAFESAGCRVDHPGGISERFWVCEGM